MLDKKNITVVCKEKTDHFIRPIINHLNKNHYVQQILYKTSWGLSPTSCHGDIIFIEWAGKAAYKLAKKNLRNKKIFIRLHRYEIDTKWMQKIHWGNIQGIIFVNPELERQFKTNINNKVKTIYIPNAIDINNFPFHIPTIENSMLIYSQSFSSRKGYLELVEIFETIIAQASTVTLTIAAKISTRKSDLHYYSEIINLISRKNLQDNIRVRIIKNDCEIISLLQKHNAIISYSHHESFHYSFAEGLLSGLEGFCNNWNNWQADYFWQPWCYNKSAEFISTIVNWSNQPLEIRIKKTKLNRQYIIDNFSAKIIAAKYDQLFANEASRV
jgi:hypothetical protein